MGCLISSLFNNDNSDNNNIKQLFVEEKNNNNETLITNKKKIQRKFPRNLEYQKILNIRAIISSTIDGCYYNQNIQIPIGIINLITEYLISRLAIINGTSLVELDQFIISTNSNNKTNQILLSYLENKPRNISYLENKPRNILLWTNLISLNKVEKFYDDDDYQQYQIQPDNVILTLKGYCYIIGHNKNYTPHITTLPLPLETKESPSTSPIPFPIFPPLNLLPFSHPVVANLKFKTQSSLSSLQFNYEDRIFICNREMLLPNTQQDFVPQWYDPQTLEWKRLPKIPDTDQDCRRSSIFTHLVHENMLYIWRKYDRHPAQDQKEERFIVSKFHPNRLKWTSSHMNLDHTGNPILMNTPLAISIKNQGILIIDTMIDHLLFHQSSISRMAKIEMNNNNNDDHHLLTEYEMLEKYDNIPDYLHWFYIGIIPMEAKINITKSNKSWSTWKIKSQFGHYDKETQLVHYVRILISYSLDPDHHQHHQILQYWTIKIDVSRNLGRSDNENNRDYNYYENLKYKQYIWTLVSTHNYYDDDSRNIDYYQKKVKYRRQIRQKKRKNSSDNSNYSDREGESDNSDSDSYEYKYVDEYIFAHTSELHNTKDITTVVNL
jgi:hypothetical protein